MADDRYEVLTGRALELGASDARVLPAEEIPVEDFFVDYCRTPRCEGYEMSANCPPNVISPSEFRKRLEGYEHALVFKVDVPMEVLQGEGRREVARFIHETSARLERHALELGFNRSEAYAGASCRFLFCPTQERCAALTGDDGCRNPELARPSMSGVGVDFRRLSDAVGWHPQPDGEDANEGYAPVGLMAGMVLLG